MDNICWKNKYSGSWAAVVQGKLTMTTRTCWCMNLLRFVLTETWYMGTTDSRCYLVALIVVSECDEQ